MIIHLDADAFFASVEQAADPRLRNKPIAVGGAKRGVIASASYEARRLGVGTAMPTARARKICPALVVLPGDFEKYERFSRLMFSYAYDHTPMVEVTSIDEGYFDLRGVRNKSPVEIAQIIRRAIAGSLRIPVSEGIASSKLVSAIASKLKKPSAFLEVPAGCEREFLAPLDSAWLPGVGPRLAQTLHRAGLERIAGVAATPPEKLALFAGGMAGKLSEYARGIDNRPVVPDAPEAKSCSEQETFDEDTTNPDLVLARLRVMADNLLRRLRAEGRALRTVEVRLRYNDFEETRRSESLAEPTDLGDDIYPLVRRLLNRAWERRVSIRLIALKFSNFYDGLFQSGLPLIDAGPDHDQRRRLARVADELRDRYGISACLRAHDLYLREPPPAPSLLEEEGPRSPAVGRIPTRATVHYRNAKSAKPPSTDWIPINCRSGYDFLNSLLRPADVVALAVRNGHRAVALADPNLHGVVEFAQAARDAGIHAVIGAALVVDDAPVNAYVRDRTGYHNLCRLLSLKKLTKRILADFREGLVLRFSPRIPPPIRYARPGQRGLFNVLSSIRTLTLLEHKTADKCDAPLHYAPPRDAELARDSLEIAEACSHTFDFAPPRFPEFYPPDGSTPREFLRRLATEGAQRRYGSRPPDAVNRQLREELDIIAEVGYEEYFLLTWDLLWNECHPRGIEWITRGSAADSLVCYCLGISDVCPIRFELYFRRFLNRDRMALHKLPDIDLDFAHDRRDEVVDLVFNKFGERAAVVGGFNTFRGRSAFADIAKVLGVSEFQIRRMTEHIPHVSATNLEERIAESRECGDIVWEENPHKAALALARHLDGMPRHPKMHPCGVVLSRGPILEITPLFESRKGWPTAHLDMDGVEAAGLVKMDLLAQGGLAVIRDTRAMLAARGITVDIKGLAPWGNKEIWDMIASGGGRGVHHIESPAMTSLCRMVGVSNIDDLIAVVSVIRPGAANNLKKEQFARRARGLEPVCFAHPSLESCLRTTYGVVAYEEHILQICEAFAGMNAGRADILRRALVKCDSEKIIQMGREFVAHAKQKGRSPEEIRAVWELVNGFQGYAFCRAHSTAYGVEAYEAAHLKRHHPREFLAAVLTHGKGFYNRLVYSIECRRLGFTFLHPDINLATDRFEPVGPHGIRAPLALVKGLSAALIERWSQEKPFFSLRDFHARCHPSRDEMDALIRAGAFDSFGKSRVRQFWEFHALAQWPGGGRQRLLFEEGETPDPPSIPLREPTPLERLRDEQELLGFPIGDHPLALFPGIAWETYCPIADLQRYPEQTVTVAGLIIEDRIHRQNDGRNMKFLSLCDPTGILECELFADVYARYGLLTVRHPVVEITGRVTPFESGMGYTLCARSLRPARSLGRLSSKPREMVAQ